MLSKRTALRAATEGKKLRGLWFRRRAVGRLVRLSGASSARLPSTTLRDSGFMPLLNARGPETQQGSRELDALDSRTRSSNCPRSASRVVPNPHKHWEFLRSRRSGSSQLHREDSRSAVERSGRRKHDSRAKAVPPPGCFDRASYALPLCGRVHSADF